MRNSRLIGGKPKIGIRPIIDGRRGGIRESLEDMTMAMAHKVAELYSSVLRPYRDWETDRKSTRLNSSHITRSRMPSSA